MKRAFLFFALTACHATQQADTATASITLSSTGIGFDDLVFAPTARRVLLPAAASGEIAEVDPATFEVTRLQAFPATGHAYQSGRHDNGVTSIAASRAPPPPTPTASTSSTTTGRAIASSPPAPAAPR